MVRAGRGGPWRAGLVCSLASSPAPDPPCWSLCHCQWGMGHFSAAMLVSGALGGGWEFDRAPLVIREVVIIVLVNYYNYCN